MKFPKIVIPLVAIGTIGLASFAAPTFSSIEKTPEINGSIFYSMKNPPSGFSLVAGYNNSELPELTGKQNPNPIKNPSGTCTFSPQISYLPAAGTNRGDKYLTLSYIYENAQVSSHLPSPIKKRHVSAGDTHLEILTSSFDVPASKDSGTDNETGYNRTLAVRAMDTTVPIPYASETTAKGIPAVVMTYDCQTANDFKDSEFSALLSSVNVDLKNTVSTSAPKKDAETPTTATSPPTSPTGSETPLQSPNEPDSDDPSASTSDALETESSPLTSEETSNP